jgi:phosphatidate cytidylyltransferase
VTTTHQPTAWPYRPSPLMIRILSGFVIIAVVLGGVFLGLYGVYALVVLLGGLALWEFRSLSDKMGSRAPSWLLFPLGAFFAFSGTVLKQVDLAVVLSIALVVGLGGFLFVPGRRQGLSRWAMGLAGALYIGMPFNYYLLLYTSKPHGLIWTVFTIFAVIASDAAALLVGSRIGRHQFFPAISPKKTLEGAIAGLVAAVLVMLVGVSVVLGISPLHAVVLGVLVGITAVMGDLVESQMKRIADVKDSSNLIPGHGGVLDRIDSILFPPILVYFYVALFGLLAR